jgi:DNA-binding protein HU-beta
LEDVIELITKLLKKGERIRNSGLGILEARKRAAQTGRRPAAGEAIIKASKKVAFRSPKELKLTI